MQEARSKFSFDVEPENSVAVDPLDGNLSPEGSAVLHFRRLSPSASTADDPHRRLDILKPRLSNGESPPGFLGFAVNMIDVESKN
ncbi:hypothetical protein Pint_22653 [Pistacia integerrima]|uniref:Uncharacterized protein n=1 Tax=Pistacia integerrima TaxID=434235 RepID=A0ACC0YIK5_9ROSI|nr:hypothetical protein Pint_22653 [Pistacia integerrima]